MSAELAAAVVNWPEAERTDSTVIAQAARPAARHRGDQLIVVHRFSIAFRRQQVHRRGKLRLADTSALARLRHPQVRTVLGPLIEAGLVAT
jgi:putative heme degradation protein